MIFALLTTMNSEVNVHIVDVLDCSHDNQEFRPEIHRLWGPVCPSGRNKQSFGRAQEYKLRGECAQMIRRKYCVAAQRLTTV